MNLIKLTVLFLLILLFASACERVIEVDLNSAEPRHVIEGYVTNGEEFHTVKITETKNFTEDNQFTYVTNATVTLSDNQGNSAVMEPSPEGVFVNASLAGVPGRTYYLKVEVGDQVYTATSTMPLPVPMDSIYVDKMENFGRAMYIPTVVFQDPAETENYYRYIMSINDKRVKNIYVRSDRNSNGRQTSRGLVYFDEDSPIEPGDIINVQMQSIDKSVYKYFTNLDETIRQSAATPANPVSNISAGALGYFSAHTVQSANIVVE